MTLAAALQHQREQGIRKGPDCRLCVAIRTLSGPDAQALKDALADEVITAAAISRALETEGIIVRAPVINRHRRGECQQR